jgi:Putative zinc-finger
MGGNSQLVRIAATGALSGWNPPKNLTIFIDGYHRYAMWDAAYVLGSLSAGDQREFETHMADCSACRQAVVEISGMPAMLSQFYGNDIAAINGPGHSESSAMRWRSNPRAVAAT